MPRRWIQVLITTPTVLATVDAIIAAAGAALVASRYGISGGGLVFISLGTFVGVWTSLLALQVQI